MELLTFSLNITLDGCVDHQEGIADEETHVFFGRLVVPARSGEISVAQSTVHAFPGV